MADFIAGLIRWALRAILLLVGVVVFLGVMALGLVLALVWALRALWARLTGRPVAPWVMPLDPRAGWRTVYQRGQARGAAAPGHKGGDVTDVTEVRETPGEWPESQFPRALPGQADADVTDVQPREPHRRS